jgi:hypothetical protein
MEGSNEIHEGIIIDDEEDKSLCDTLETSESETIPSTEPQMHTNNVM